MGGNAKKSRQSSSSSRAPERGRWSSGRKLDVVLRVLRGEDLDTLSRELGVTAARLAEWRDAFLAGGQSALKARAPDHRDEDNQRLKAKVGELMMENELLSEKIDVLEAGRHPQQGRSRR